MHKTAITLQNHGFDVTIVGRLLKNSIEIKRPYKTVRFKNLFYRKAFFYIEHNIKIFFYLLFHKADIILSVDLDTLLACFLAAKIMKKKLVFDSHELFSELPEVVDRPFIKKFWKLLEKKLLPKVHFSYTVSQSIADYYGRLYGVKMGVIRNVGLYRNIKFKLFIDKPKIIIYKGVLNINRGIEEMILAMKYLNNAKFWIIGDGYLRSSLEKLVKEKNLENKVIFWGQLEPMKAEALLILAHLGISLEKPIGLSYTYALPNKLFDYIQAELPVLCSNLPEMKKIVRHYKVGEIARSRSPLNLAYQISEIIYNPRKLRYYCKNAKKAKKELCWEKEEQKLLQYFIDDNKAF